jgi:hypothetical protein
MQLKNPKDFWAGVMFASVGFGFAIIVKVFEYPMGSAVRMGAGYFPYVLGWILGVLGLIIIAKALVSQGGPVSKFAWRPIFWVLLAVCIFGLTVKHIGMVLAIYILVLVSAFGGHEFKWKEQLIAATVLAIGCVLVFKIGLKLPFPVAPDFIAAFLPNALK